MEIYLSIIAIVISVASCLITVGIFWWTVSRDRKQATLDAYNRLQKQSLDYLNKYKTSEVKEIAKCRTSEEYIKISAYIARIEHFCVGVTQKIYDEKTVYELAHGYFDGRLRNRIEPIITQKNQAGSDYYANIHKVYEWMEKREKNNKNLLLKIKNRHGR